MPFKHLVTMLALLFATVSSWALPSTCTVEGGLPDLYPGSAYISSYGVNGSTGSFTYCTPFQVASALDLDIFVAGVVLQPSLMFMVEYALYGPGLSPMATNLSGSSSFANLAPGDYLLMIDAEASTMPLGNPGETAGRLQMNFSASDPSHPVSEPGSLGLLVLGLVGLALRVRRRLAGCSFKLHRPSTTTGLGHAYAGRCNQLPTVAMGWRDANSMRPAPTPR